MLNAFLYQLFLWYSLPLLLAVLYLKFRFRFLLRKEIYFFDRHWFAFSVFPGNIQPVFNDMDCLCGLWSAD